MQADGSASKGAPPESDPQQHFLEVTKTARVWSLGAARSSPDELWLVCHGYRQLARRFLRRFEGIGSDRRHIVAPEALSRFYVDSKGGRHGPEARVGATWMTREDREHEITDYITYLDRVARRFVTGLGAPPALTGFGFSQGVHTATRWAMLGSTPVQRLILWGAYVPPDLDLARVAERWRSTRVIQVHGDVDPSRSDDLARQQAERLAKAGLEIEHRSHSGGHEIDAELLAELAEAG